MMNVLILTAGLWVGSLSDSQPVLTQDPPTQEEDPQLPGPRKKVAGLSTVRIESEILFDSAPDLPHKLDFVMAFPGRSRSSLSLIGGRSSQRTLTFQFGSRLWRIAPGTADSKPIQGAFADASRIELELRRAVFLWPDGFNWKAHGDAACRVDLEGLGFLVARFDAAHKEPLAEPSSRPTSISSFDTNGQGRESMQGITWNKSLGRTWPRTLTVHSRGRPVWAESVQAIETHVRYIDAWFLPPDQRRPAHRSPAPNTTHLDLGSMAVRAWPLAENATIKHALDEIGRLQVSELGRLRKQGHTLSQAQLIELDSSGRPTAVLLQLEQPVRALPEDWIQLPPRPAVARSLPAPRVTPEDVRQLRKALPSEIEMPISILLRVYPEREGLRRSQLVIALSPRED